MTNRTFLRVSKKVGAAYTLIPLFFSFWLISPAQAQRWEIGAGLGTTGYIGDFAPTPHPSTHNLAGTIFVRQNFSPVFALRYGITLGGIRGNAATVNDGYLSRYADTLNLSFRTLVTELAVVGEYNFFDYRNEKYRKWSPYLFGGIGVFIFTPGNPGSPLSPATELNPALAIQPAIPFGLGAKFVLSRHWNLGVELGARKTFTDYLDNASNVVQSPVGLTGWQRGNPNTNDWYYFAGVKLSYTIYSILCPYPWGSNPPI